MTSRERILCALKREVPDRIPWTPLIDGYYLSSLEKPTNQVDAIRDFGGDIFARHIPTYKGVLSVRGLATIMLGSAKNNISSSNNSYSETVRGKGDIEVTTKESDGRISQIFKTPVGTIESKFVRNETSPFIPFTTEHCIKSIEDLRVFRYIFENTEYEPLYDVFVEEDAYIGDDGIGTTTSPTSPFHVLLEIEIGIENFYYMLWDHKSELEELMEVMHEQNKEAYSIIAASPAKVVIDYENTSTTTMSPDMFEKYCQPHINDYADIMHKTGKIFLTHMCGTLKRLEKQLADSRMNGIVDVAPPPTGDVTLGEAKKMWGANKILMGGIDSTAFKGLSPGELVEYVRDILKDIAPGDGIFIGSADATPQGTPIENMRAVSDAIAKYGKYPLSL